MLVTLRFHAKYRQFLCSITTEIISEHRSTNWNPKDESSLLTQIRNKNLLDGLPCIILDRVNKYGGWPTVSKWGTLPTQSICPQISITHTFRVLAPVGDDKGPLCTTPIPLTVRVSPFSRGHLLPSGSLVNLNSSNWSISSVWSPSPRSPLCLSVSSYYKKEETCRTLDFTRVEYTVSTRGKWQCLNFKGQGHPHWSGKHVSKGWTWVYKIGVLSQLSVSSQKSISNVSG